MNLNLSRPSRAGIRLTALAGLALSACMLATSLVTPESDPAFAALTSSGEVTISVPPADANGGQPLTSGGSATRLAILPPQNAACPGDSATDGYRVQTYVVPANVDPSTLSFDNVGPTPYGLGAEFRQPLYTPTGDGYVNASTATTPVGMLTDIPIFSFEIYTPDGPSLLPPGTYNLGFACTKGPVGPTQVTRFWNMQVTFIADPNDKPAGLTWEVVVGTPAEESSTSSSSSTTTTVGGSSTTTTTGSSTTSSTTAGGTTTTSSASPWGNPGSSGGAGSGYQRSIVATGSSPGWTIFWAVLVLAFGRLTLLTARPIRTRTNRSR